MAENDPSTSEAATWNVTSKFGVVKYDFTPSGDQQVSLKKAQKVVITAAYGDQWYLGGVIEASQDDDNIDAEENKSDGDRVDSTAYIVTSHGIFPTAFVTECPSPPTDDDVVNTLNQKDCSADTIMNELCQTIVEWRMLMNTHFRAKRFREFSSFKRRLQQLITLRYQLSVAEEDDDWIELSSKVLETIEKGRRLTGLDMIIRTPDGLRADDMNTDVFTLLRMHREVANADKEEQEDFSSPATTGDPLSQLLKMRREKGQLATRINKPATTADGKPKSMDINNHVYFDFKDFVAPPPEEGGECGDFYELAFSLYKSEEKKFITESFLVRLTSDNMPEIHQIGRLMTLFRDLQPKELVNLYLVCRVVRVGYRLLDPHDSSSRIGGKSKKGGDAPTRPPLRRPYACAVLDLCHGVFGSKKRDHTMTMYQVKEESTYHMLHQHIISKSMQHIEPVPKATGIVVRVKLFHGDYDRVARKHPELGGGSATDDASALASPRGGGGGDKRCSMTHKFAFPEVINPELVRNDLYLTLSHLDFAQTLKHTANIEVILTARLDNGDPIPGCFSSGSGTVFEDSYRSMVLYHNNSPKLDEIIRIKLPVQVYPRIHIYFTVRNVSTKKETSQSFFGFLKLTTEQGVAIHNAEHSIAVYKGKGKVVLDHSFYLKEDKREANCQRVGKILSKTFLASTCITQNGPVHNLTRWQSIPEMSLLADYLNKITFVDKAELLKFLTPVLNSLFGILDSKELGKPLSIFVYNAIVHIVCVLLDEKTAQYANLRTLLDSYLEQTYHCRMAHHYLLKSVLYYMDHLKSQNYAQLLRQSIKGLEYTVKFAITSRDIVRSEAGNEANSDELDAQDREFAEDFVKLFDGFTTVMELDSPSLLGLQALTIKAFPSLVEGLAKLYDAERISKMIKSFVATIRTSEKPGFVLNIEKLSMITQLSGKAFFSAPDAIRYNVPIAVDIVATHMKQGRKELLECATTMANILRTIQSVAKDEAVAARASVSRGGSAIRTRDGGSGISGQPPAARRRVPPSMKAPSLPAACVTALPADDPLMVVTRLMPGIMEAIQTLSYDKKNCMTFNTCLLSIFDSMSDRHFEAFIESFKGELSRNSFFVSVFKHFEKVLREQQGSFPSSWFVLCMWQYAAIKKVLVRVCELLLTQQSRLTTVSAPRGGVNVSRKFGPEQELWKKTFPLLASLVVSRGLRRETFTASKQMVMRDRYGEDTRVSLTALMRTMWFAISDNGKTPPTTTNIDNTPTPAADLKMGPHHRQMTFVPMLVGPAIEMVMLVQQPDVLRTSCELLYSFLEKEYLSSGQVSRSEIALIDHLDKMAREGTIDPASSDYLVAYLHSKFGGDPSSAPTPPSKGSTEATDGASGSVSSGNNVAGGVGGSGSGISGNGSPSNFRTGGVPPKDGGGDVVSVYREVGVTFVASLARMLSLLLEYQAIPAGPEWEDERVFATMKLLNYLIQSNRRDQYVKYVHNLCQQHLRNKNFTEAGLTLLMHADQLEWTHEMLPPLTDVSPPMPAESRMARKEGIYRLAMEYLNMGKAWEIAVKLLQELRTHYEFTIYDYKGLGCLLRNEADYYEKIEAEDRYFGEYFRVAYYGNGFPPNLRNKEFIYRGFELERITSFIARTRSKFPNADLLKSNKPVEEETLTSDGQFLLIQTVYPSSIMAMQGEGERKFAAAMPVRVQNYHRSNGVQVFKYTRSYRKMKEKSDNEFEDLWIMHNYLKTADTFPTILSRSPVVERKEDEKSPIENAISSIEEKNDQVVALVKKYTIDPRYNINPLTLALNGVIDAEVNGGVKKYQSAFFTAKYLKDNPHQADNVKALKRVLLESIPVLEEGMHMHGRICPDVLKPLQEKLETFFVSMKDTITATCSD